MTQIFPQDNDWQVKARVFLSQFVESCADKKCPGCEWDMDGIIEYINTLMHHAAMVEKYAFLEGRRCSQCGMEKEHEPMNDMCDNCWEDA